MRPVVQQDRTGCAIASVAAIVGESYRAVKQTAAGLGIDVRDAKLWRDTRPVRQLLASYRVTVARKQTPFTSWAALPSCALLAIKWHRERTGPAWHWVVFVREGEASCVLDSKRTLRTHRRTDFGRMKPRWFLRLEQR